jgi:hypothetical protein
MKKLNLNEELNRMQKLAGVLKEDDAASRGVEYGFNPEAGGDEYEEFEKLKNAESNGLNADFSIILKADDSAKSKLISLEIPEEPNGNEMTKLPDDKLHTTLTSIKSFKPFKEEFKDFVLPEEINAPDAILGEGKFVYRDEQGKVTYVIALDNQNEFKEFVDKIYNSLGLENPEPNRFYHITVANNASGNPFKSIGDVTEVDF